MQDSMNNTKPDGWRSPTRTELKEAAREFYTEGYYYTTALMEPWLLCFKAEAQLDCDHVTSIQLRALVGIRGNVFSEN